MIMILIIKTNYNIVLAITARTATPRFTLVGNSKLYFTTAVKMDEVVVVSNQYNIIHNDHEQAGQHDQEEKTHEKQEELNDIFLFLLAFLQQKHHIHIGHVTTTARREFKFSPSIV